MRRNKRRGEINTYNFRSNDIGVPEIIKVWTPRHARAWHIKKIEIKEANDGEFHVFYINKWLRSRRSNADVFMDSLTLVKQLTRQVRNLKRKNSALQEKYDRCMASPLDSDAHNHLGTSSSSQGNNPPPANPTVLSPRAMNFMCKFFGKLNQKLSRTENDVCVWTEALNITPASIHSR